MSRFKRYAHSLLSGYALLGANMLYTLASYPLALHYLTTEQFGLWATTTSIAGYIALVDFGMGGSVARILIDHKDDHSRGGYGSVIQTGMLVGLAQGILVLLAGILLALLAAPLLHVPAGLQRDFTWLMIGQAVVSAVSFSGRIFLYLLTAHQRYDVSNYAGMSSLVLTYAVMWWLFASGVGVLSLVWAQLAATILSVAVNAGFCWRLRFLPRRGDWGRPTLERFREVFAFGRDIFLYALGGQMINASQTLLLTRLFGLNMSALWAQHTRTYLLLLQTIYRVFDYSSAAFAEMIVRGEKSRLADRFKEVVLLSTSLSVAAAALFALCNSAFVTVWLHPEPGWSPVNDLLLAVWLVLCVSIHAHTGLVGQTKRFAFLRYLFFVEGFAFIALTLLLHRFGGVTLMILISVGCSLAISFPYGLRRTHDYFGMDWTALARWHTAALVMVLYLLPVGLLTWWFTRQLPPLPRLVTGGVVFGLWNLWVFMRRGLDESLQREILRRVPDWAKPALARIGFGRSQAAL